MHRPSCVVSVAALSDKLHALDAVLRDLWIGHVFWIRNVVTARLAGDAAAEGVAVVLKATHHCMTTRGVMKPGTDLVTSRMLGRFRDDPLLRQEMLRHVE